MGFDFSPRSKEQLQGSKGEAQTEEPEGSREAQTKEAEGSNEEAHPEDEKPSEAKDADMDDGLDASQNSPGGEDMKDEGPNLCDETGNPIPLQSIPVKDDVNHPSPPKKNLSLSPGAVDRRMRRVFEPRANGSHKVPERFVAEWKKKGAARKSLEKILASCGYDVVTWPAIPALNMFWGSLTSTRQPHSHGSFRKSLRKNSTKSWRPTSKTNLSSKVSSYLKKTC